MAISKLSKKAEYLTVIFLYVIFTLIFFKDIFSKLYVVPIGDSYFSFYSWNTFFRNCIVRGIFPFWNPLILCGHPYHLESVSNFSLSNFLLIFLNVNAAWNTKVFLSSLMSGFFMFILLRRQIKLSFAASFIGGIIFMFLVPDIDDNPLYFLPLIFIFVNKWLSTKKFLWVFILGFLLMLYFFNANPHFVLYFCFFLFLYIFFSLIFQKTHKGIKNIFLCGLKASTPFLIFVSLSLSRILPMYELSQISHRDTMVSICYMFFPLDLINFIYPKFYLSSLCPDLNFIPQRIFYGISSLLFGKEKVEFVSSPYIGIIPLIFAFAIFFKKNKNFIEKFFMCSAIAVVLYVIFNPLLHIITQRLTLLKNFPFVGRSYSIYYFSMAILASLGIENLLIKENLSLKAIKRILFWLSFFIIFLIVLKTIIYALLSIFDKKISLFLLEKVLPAMLKQGSYSASSEFYSMRFDQLFVFLKSWASPENIYFIFPSLFIISSVTSIYFFIKKRISKKLFLSLAAVLIFLDILFNLGMQAISYQDLVPAYKSAEYLKRQEGIFRVMPILQNYDTKNPTPKDERTFLRPETNLLYNIATPEGYRSLIINHYAQVMGLLVNKSPKDLKARLCEFDRIDDRLADFLNIKYVVTFPNNDKFKNGYDLVYEDGIHKVLLNRNVLSRAFLVHNIKIIKQKEEILKEIKSDFDFSKSVILEADIGSFKSNDAKSYSSSVFIEKYEPNNISISVDNPYDGFLVLLDCYYPGWKVYVDGKPNKIFKANYIFRAVRVAEGKHTVKFLYSPTSLKIGFMLSASFFIFWLILCIFLRNKSKPSAQYGKS
jgi:hypothetical protein